MQLRTVMEPLFIPLTMDEWKRSFDRIDNVTSVSSEACHNATFPPQIP